LVVGGDVASRRTARERARWRRTQVGFIFQTDDLLPHLTAWENVTQQLAMSGDETADPAAAGSLLDELGVAESRDKLPDQLSGGQRQRVAVARALVHDPVLILADEPTGAVDRPNAVAILALLVRAQRARGATLVVVTHDREVAARLDRSVLLDDGRLVAGGDRS